MSRVRLSSKNAAPTMRPRRPTPMIPTPTLSLAPRICPIRPRRHGDRGHRSAAFEKSSAIHTENAPFNAWYAGPITVNPCLDPSSRSSSSIAPARPVVLFQNICNFGKRQRALAQRDLYLITVVRKWIAVRRDECLRTKSGTSMPVRYAWPASSKNQTSAGSVAVYSASISFPLYVYSGQ